MEEDLCRNAGNLNKRIYSANSCLCGLSRMTQENLTYQIQYLKVENEILRKRIGKCIRPTAIEKRKLLKFGAPLGKAKAWESRTLEEKIPILKSIAKVAHYDANEGTLEIMLHKGEKSHQFALTLAELKHIPYHRQQAEISKEPLIRRSLILGHQISEVIKEKKCGIREVVNWTGIIRPRLCQFIDMLLLSPKIQEEILLSEDKAIFDIPEYKLRYILAEIDWDTQQKLWNNLLESYQK